MPGFLTDLRYSVRVLMRRPLVTALAALTLALAIGANTVVFSVADAVLFRPLPYANPEQLVYLNNEYVKQDGVFVAAVSPPEFIEYSQLGDIFQSVVAIRESSYNLTEDDRPERVQGSLVSGSFFPMLGVRAALGRALAPADDQPGNEAVLVISHSLWQRRYGGDEEIVGREILSNGVKYTIVGVAPSAFSFPPSVEIWQPIALMPSQIAESQRGNQFLTVLARLQPEVVLEEARARIAVVAERVRERFPGRYTAESGWRLQLVSLKEATVGEEKLPLLVVGGAVVFVLLLACANIGNLLLVQIGRRRREIAVRTAYGAGSWRIARLILAQSLLLAVTGGAAGLFAAFWSLDILRGLLPGDFPRLEEISIDYRVLSFTGVACLVSGLLFGILPAWQVVRTSPNEILKQGGRDGSLSYRERLSQRAAAAFQIAAAIVLLNATGLMIRTLTSLENVDPGFNSANRLTMQVLLPRARYETAEIDPFYTSVLERLRSLPGVRSAGATSALPFSGVENSGTFHIESAPAAAGQGLPHADIRFVTPEYFATMGIPLVDGRVFDSRDANGAVPVALVDEALAREYWGNRFPVGERVSRFSPASGRWISVVGVVGSVQHRELSAKRKGVLYLPSAQAPSRAMTLVLHTERKPASYTGAARSAVFAIDREQPIYAIKTMNEWLKASLERRQFTLAALAVFSLVAISLAGVGIYGVIAGGVAERVREIGVRLALGATGGDILRGIAAESMKLALAGAAAGILVSQGVTRTLRGLLFGVAPGNPATLAVSVILMAGLALIACYLPARAASRTDPMAALREE